MADTLKDMPIFALKIDMDNKLLGFKTVHENVVWMELHAADWFPVLTSSLDGCPLSLLSSGGSHWATVQTSANLQVACQPEIKHVSACVAHNKVKYIGFLHSHTKLNPHCKMGVNDKLLSIHYQPFLPEATLSHCPWPEWKIARVDTEIGQTW